MLAFLSQGKDKKAASTAELKGLQKTLETNGNLRALDSARVPLSLAMYCYWLQVHEHHQLFLLPDQPRQPSHGRGRGSAPLGTVGARG